MIKIKIFSQFKDRDKRNFIIYGIGQAFNLISPLIVAPFVISKCNIEGFGKIGLGFVLALFLILIVDYSFDVKGVKQASENRNNPKQLENILSTALATKLVLFMIAFFLALALIIFVPFFQEEKTLFFLSVTIVFAQVFNPVWFLQGVEQFTLSSILNIVSKSLYVVFVFIFINAPNDYIFVNFILGTSALVTNIIGLAILYSLYKIKIKLPEFSKIKLVLKRDFTFCLSQLFLSLRQISPLLLTSYFLGFYVAGQYKVLEQVISFLRTFNQVFLKFFYPKACYKYMISAREGFIFWKKYIKFDVLFTFLFCALIFVFSRSVLRFFNLESHLILELSYYLKITCFIPFLMSFSLSLEQLIFIFNRNKEYVRITIFVTFINVLLILLVVESQQIFGILMTLLIAEVMFILLYIKSISRHNSKTIELK